jgi:hypothetical protein
VVIEIKAGKFKPEHAGQLSFYLTAVDAQVKATEDAPTIGILLTAWSPNTRYATRTSRLASPSTRWWNRCPSIEQIERELGEVE